MLRVRFFSVVVIILTLLVGCGDDKNTLKVGVMSGPETDVIKTAKDIAKKRYDLNVKIVTFGDYSLPNAALSDGSIDMNIFQHAPYLNATNQARGYDLVSVGETFIYPMGIYSNRYKSLSELPNGATIAIPNDPTNEARALYLLEQSGLIELPKSAHRETTKYFVSAKDIIKNQQDLKIKPLNAAQLPRALDDVDAALINTNYAIPAGLSPSKDALFKENKDSIYANIMVVRNGDQQNPKIIEFVKAVHSPEVAEKTKALFGDNAIIMWNPAQEDAHNDRVDKLSI